MSEVQWEESELEREDGRKGGVHSPGADGGGREIRRGTSCFRWQRWRQARRSRGCQVTGRQNWYPGSQQDGDPPLRGVGSGR